MPPSPAIHSIDITLDRTDPSLLTDSLKGTCRTSLLSFFQCHSLFLALLHSTFFHRVFGNIQPLTRDILDVTFVPLLFQNNGLTFVQPYADDPDLESLIDSKVTAFLRYIETAPKSAATDSLTTVQEDGTIISQLSIHFFEKVTRRASWWGSRPSDSEVCWEKWEINCTFLPLLPQHSAARGIERTEKDDRRGIMEQQLFMALGKVVRLTQKTDHIPPITTNEANPFPYQVHAPLSSRCRC